MLIRKKSSGTSISNSPNVKFVSALPVTLLPLNVAVASHTTGRVTSRTVRSPSMMKVVSPDVGRGHSSLLMSVATKMISRIGVRFNCIVTKIVIAARLVAA